MRPRTTVHRSRRGDSRRRNRRRDKPPGALGGDDSPRSPPAAGRAPSASATVRAPAPLVRPRGASTATYGLRRYAPDPQPPRDARHAHRAPPAQAATVPPRRRALSASTPRPVVLMYGRPPPPTGTLSQGVSDGRDVLELERKPPRARLQQGHDRRRTTSTSDTTDAVEDWQDDNRPVADRHGRASVASSSRAARAASPRAPRTSARRSRAGATVLTVLGHQPRRGRRPRRRQAEPRPRRRRRQPSRSRAASGRERPHQLGRPRREGPGRRQQLRLDRDDSGDRGAQLEARPCPTSTRPPVNRPTSRATTRKSAISVAGDGAARRGPGGGLRRRGRRRPAARARSARCGRVCFAGGLRRGRKASTRVRRVAVAE